MKDDLCVFQLRFVDQNLSFLTPGMLRAQTLGSTPTVLKRVKKCAGPSKSHGADDTQKSDRGEEVKRQRRVVVALAWMLLPEGNINRKSLHRIDY